ncbi:hypothetical protein TSMEX_003439 [Taenia solium]|eukprot:TsM_000431200 transcript=TsM_000431200 gene=TsM_000431200
MSDSLGSSNAALGQPPAAAITYESNNLVAKFSCAL